MRTTTLSQRGLSVRIGRSVSWIRKHGPTVKTTMVREGLGFVMRREAWTRHAYLDGRFKYYELAAPTSDEAAA